VAHDGPDARLERLQAGDAAFKKFAGSVRARREIR
jgi:hypothetical protein